MKTNLSIGRRGFTLVEIMIVVAIIALLAAVGIPGFLRARKRSQATRIINDLRLIDSAVDAYAIETNKSTGNPVGVTDWTKFLKPGIISMSPATIFWAPHAAVNRWMSFPTSPMPSKDALGHRRYRVLVALQLSRSVSSRCSRIARPRLRSSHSARRFLDLYGSSSRPEAVSRPTGR